MCVNSITIYPKPRAEAAMQRCSLKAVRKHRDVILKLFCFFFGKIHKKLPGPEPLFELFCKL